MAVKGRTIGGLAGALLLAGLLITAFEGRVLTVYPDPVTHSTPWTYCDGETQNPQPGHTYTDAECDAETVALIRKVDAAVLACTISPLPDKVRAAFDSLAWNIGTAAFCSSTLARKAKAGDLMGACKEIPRWDHAGGKTIPGLTFRRGEEMKICLEGVREAAG